MKIKLKELLNEKYLTYEDSNISNEDLGIENQNSIFKGKVHAGKKDELIKYIKDILSQLDEDTVIDVYNTIASHITGNSLKEDVNKMDYKVHFLINALTICEQALEEEGYDIVSTLELPGGKSMSKFFTGNDDKKYKLTIEEI